MPLSPAALEAWVAYIKLLDEIQQELERTGNTDGLY